MKPILESALIGLVALGASSTGRAQPTTDPGKLSCAEAYEQGQRLRNEHRLLAARSQLLLCSDDSCPAVLRGDCTRWLTEVDMAVPTVILAARDSRGTELSNVEVELDGKIVATRLDGKPLSVDPGKRLFRFSTPGAEPVVRRVTLEAGEKDLRVEASFGQVLGDGSGDRAGGVPPAAWLLGGLGVAALGGFAYFALDGRSKKQDLDHCKPACNPDDVDAARRSFVIGDVFLAVGVSALAGATIVVATRPRGKESGVSLSPSLGVGRVGFLGRF